MIKSKSLRVFCLLGIFPLFVAAFGEETEIYPSEASINALLSSRQKAFKVSLDFKRLTAPPTDTDRSLSAITHVQTLVLSGVYNDASLAALEKMVQEKKVTVLVLSGTCQATQGEHFKRLADHFGDIEGIRRYKQNNPMAGEEAAALLRAVAKCIPFLTPTVDAVKKQVWPLVVLSSNFEKDWTTHRRCFEKRDSPCTEVLCAQMREVCAVAQQHNVTVRWDGD